MNSMRRSGGALVLATAAWLGTPPCAAQVQWFERSPIPYGRFGHAMAFEPSEAR